mmetsp:Transcript_13041/g.19867  ORF Transcript_13041/g.19867 Transcript_13041/m.19867 type:complete len:107 (-) Transcript_13041:1471-1791(-)
MNSLKIICTLLMIGTASAFLACSTTRRSALVTNQRRAEVMHHVPIEIEQTQEYSSVVMRAKKGAEEEKPTADYGKIALMFVNPLNPYSWFVYFFVGIYAYAALGGN